MYIFAVGDILLLNSVINISVWMDSICEILMKILDNCNLWFELGVCDLIVGIEVECGVLWNWRLRLEEWGK